MIFIILPHFAFIFIPFSGPIVNTSLWRSPAVLLLEIYVFPKIWIIQVSDTVLFLICKRTLPSVTSRSTEQISCATLCEHPTLWMLRVFISAVKSCGYRYQTFGNLGASNRRAVVKDYFFLSLRLWAEDILPRAISLSFYRPLVRVPSTRNS